MTRIGNLCCLLCFFSTAACAAQSSDFENGIDGWSTVLLSEPINNPPENVVPAYPVLPLDDGNPGNGIYSWDPGIHTWYFSAPKSFLGNQSSFFAGEIRWDMRIFHEASIGSRTLILVGDGLALFGPIEFDSPPHLPVMPWRSFGVTLVGSSFGTDWNDPDSHATDDQVQSVLGNLTAIYIHGGWNFGGAVTHMDDVVMRHDPLLLGDANLDGVVNLLDVSPWIDCVIGGAFLQQCDINQDGVVDLLDVAPFIEILGG